MRILVDFQIDKSVEARLIGDNIIYRPDLENKNISHRRRALTAALPDALITRSLPDADTVLDWKKKQTDYPVFIICINDEEHCTDFVGEVPVYRVAERDINYAGEQAFILAESIHSNNLERSTNQALLTAVARNSTNSNNRIAMVGAGVVNLLTAYHLKENGYKLEVYDASPDPRSNQDWAFSGCTYGGDDARMFSLSESRHHLIRYYEPGAEVGDLFRKDIPDKGWLCMDEENLRGDNEGWIHELEQIPEWLPQVFNKDIISFNQESTDIWKAMQERHPQLFEDVGFIPTVLRVYSTEQQLHTAIISEGHIGSIKRILDPITLSREFPALQNAVDNDEVAGALEVIGFTVNIHKFSIKLISHLEKSGVRFHWRNEIDHIERDIQNTVTGLVSDKQKITADHYVICPGAYGNSLLSGMASDKKITGVVGAWLRIPNLDPQLNASLKISRVGFAAEGAAEGANIILGSDKNGNEIIHVSSGHGFIGDNPKRVDSHAMNHLFRVVEETAQRYFPHQYEAAQQQNMASKSLRWCVRPWTPSGLGVFELAKAQNNGLLIVTGGHNTGGFAQAQSVAMAVLAALRGKRHVMHRAYHPERLRDFMNNINATEKTVSRSEVVQASPVVQLGV